MKYRIALILVLLLFLFPLAINAETALYAEKSKPVESNYNTAREIANYMETHYCVSILIGSKCDNVVTDSFIIGDKPTGRTAFLNLLGLVDYEYEIQIIDDAFSMYPTDFFELFKCTEAPNGLRILLADQIIAERQTIAGVSTIQDGYYNIFLGIGAFNHLNIHHEIWHAMEFRITSEKPDAFNNWNQLNPEDFTYSDEYFDQDAWEQAEPKDDWFVRGYSTVNDEEDRATIIEAIFQYDDNWWTAHPHIAKKLDVLLEIIQPIFGNVFFHE